MFALLRRYREVVVVVVVAVIPLGIFLAHARHPGDRTALDRFVLTVTSPIEKGVDWAITGAMKTWQGYVWLRGTERRARELSREVNELRAENAALVQLRAENERLSRLLAFARSRPEHRAVGARVIGTRMDPKGLQLVTIDRGSDDGVRRMMPVVTTGGVLGRIHTLGARSADVLVLSDRNSSIAARVERSRARANVRGQGAPGPCRLEYALRSDDLIEGDELVTSGTDGVFPHGLPVGQVTRVKRGGHGLYQAAEVLPAVDVNRVEEVAVLVATEAPGAESGGQGPRAMNALLRVPLASVAALLLVAIGASATRQLSGGAVSVALAVPVVVWLGLETTVIEGAVGAVVVGVLLDASAGGPGGLLAFLSVLVFVGVRAGAGTFDARTPLGFGLLSGVATLGMGLGALLLLRYVSPEATAPGWNLLGRVTVEALLTGLAAPAVKWVLDRVLSPGHREQPGLLR